VTERDEFVGRMREVSRLPQYLEGVRWYKQQGMNALDAGNVDRSRGGCLKDHGRMAPDMSLGVFIVGIEVEECT